MSGHIEVFLNCLILCAVTYFCTRSAIIPVARRVALSKNFVDDPSKGERKLHSKPIPYLGGVSIYCGILVGIGVSLIFFPFLREMVKMPPWFGAYLAGSGLVLAVGTLDDIFDISAKRKLLAQITISVLAYFGGIKIDHIVLPSLGIVEVGQLSLPVTMLIFLITMNALNLIDGLDGLACGVALIAALANAALALYLGSMPVFFLAIIIVSAMAGFISHNYHPARMFLGDGGSLLLGFLVAGIGIQNIQIAGTFAETLIPILAVIYPILDIGIAIIRRGIKGKPFMSADRAHIHHKLLDLGFGQTSIFWLMIGFTSVAVTCCFMFLWGLDLFGKLLAVMLIILMVAGLTSLKYLNIGSMRFTMQLRPVFKKHNALKYLTNVHMKYAENEDEICRILSDAASKYELPALHWCDDSGCRVIRGDDKGLIEGKKTRVVKMEKTAGEIKFLLPLDMQHTDLQVEIDTIMRSIVRTMDKSLYRLRNSAKVISSHP